MNLIDCTPTHRETALPASGEAASCPCGLCGIPTRMLGTRRCDGCWELEGRIRQSPAMARRILALVEEEQRVLAPTSLAVEPAHQS